MLIRKPIRATRIYTQHYAAEVARVFSLMCPVREADWLEGWDPLLVLSESGVAEPDCVFVTRVDPHGAASTDRSSLNGQAVWFVTRHDPAGGFVEMIKIVPGVTACKLSIVLAASPGGTDATITYSHTSLGPEGDALVASFTEEHYVRFMRDWESRINHYLATGERMGTAG